jgi:mannose-6-phosphate isomerase-like protein (cupin superfamily)
MEFVIYMVKKINLKEKFSLFGDQWSPKIIAEIDDFHLKLAKLKGEFVWHSHNDEDELFLILKGTLNIQLRESELVLNEGELAIIPKGMEHKPICNEEVEVLLLEKKTIINTGNIENKKTIKELEWI